MAYGSGLHGRLGEQFAGGGLATNKGRTDNTGWHDLSEQALTMVGAAKADPPSRFGPRFGGVLRIAIP
jgi:hypothetical protein